MRRPLLETVLTLMIVMILAVPALRTLRRVEAPDLSPSYWTYIDSVAPQEDTLHKN